MLTRWRAYPRVSNDTPSENAFCCVAPGVRLSDFAIFATGVLWRARVFSSRTSSLVHSRRLTFFAMTTPLFGGGLLTHGDLFGQFYFPEDRWRRSLSSYGRLMGKPRASRIQLRKRHCTKRKSSCVSMDVIWRSLYIWMRYLHRLAFGSIERGCGNGVSLDSQPSESNGAHWLIGIKGAPCKLQRLDSGDRTLIERLIVSSRRDFFSCARQSRSRTDKHIDPPPCHLF